MKLLGALGLGLALLMFASASNSFAESKVEVKSPIEKIYLPRGFTSADQAEVILKGEYPSTCYQPKDAFYDVDTGRREIIVHATSWLDEEGFCLQVMTPFIQTIKLGAVPAGDYDVVVAADPGVWSALMIEEPQLEAPAPVYAPVHEAALIYDRVTGKQALHLAGELPYFLIGCMVIRDVIVEQFAGEIVQVRPLAEIIDGPECALQPGDHRYEIRQGLDEAFSGEGLLHVRGYQGRNLNVLIDMPF